MKILKYLLFLILLVIIGSAIYFGTKDGSYDIQDSVVIAAPSQVVFDKVNNFKSWESWNAWKNDDPDIGYTYAEKSSGEGATFSWDGKKSGSITTKKVIPNSEIIQDITYNSPTGKSEAEMYWKFEGMGDSTKVIWGTKGEHSLVEKAYSSLKKSNFTTTIHKMNRTALGNIAEEVQGDMKKYSINVDGVTQYGGGYYMYTTSVAKQQEVGQKSISMMSVVQEFIAKNKLNKAGDPFILFNETDTANNTVIFSTGIPVREQVITPEGSPVVCGFMDPISAVKVSLKGNTDYIPQALQKGIEYLGNNDLVKDPAQKMFEIYVTDKIQDPNPANWLTEIYIPIQPKEQPTETFINIPIQ